MSDVIRLLPDSIANQIAAGEVVQRPSSVVKEMLENSIDAGATNIQLIIKDAGKSLIQIIDDGKGMSTTDARMSFERHATSKISSSEDLFKIKTLGFRGEALASIAAVAQVEMKTKRKEDELGTLLQIEASKIKKHEPEAIKEGTSISVRNLFYNVPARRNFLKSNPVEQRHINDEFVRVALAHPEVSFSLLQNDLEVYKLEEGKLSKRIIQLFGKSYQQQLIACSEETDLVKVKGYVGKPEFSKKTRGDQYFFINNRFIKSSYLHHAVSTAFEGLLKEDYFPFYVLFLEIDPVHVDINVHPTKTEVKFDDERTLYGVIQSAVKQALASFNVTPSLDFSTDVSFQHLNLQRENENRITRSERSYGQFKDLEKPDPARLRKLNELYAAAASEELINIEQAKKEVESTLTYPSEERITDTRKRAPYLLHNRYILKQVKSGMMVLEIEAALERILFEHYAKKTPKSKQSSQSCLFPQQIPLSASDFNLVHEIKEEITALGFEFEVLGENRVVIQGIPSDLAPCNEKEVFEGLIEQYKYNVSTLKVPKDESLPRALAKRMAGIKAKTIQESEHDHLIDRLFACEQPNFTPEGQATYVLISLDQMIDWFSK